MQNVFDTGPLPSVRQVEAVYDAVAYSYEAGEFPSDMDQYTANFVAGDGGLLNSLIHLRRALELLEVERDRGLRLAIKAAGVEPWHGQVKT